MDRPSWEIIKWWELRRIPYTFLVGMVAVVSFFLTNSIAEKYAQAGEHFLKPASLLIGVPVALFVANIFYTLGWLLELLRKKLTGNDDPGFRGIAFYSGLIVSLLLMSLPLWIALLNYLRSNS